MRFKMKRRLFRLFLFATISLTIFGLLAFVTASPDTIFLDDFESGFTPWTGTSGTPTQSSTQAHNNTYSMKCDAYGDYAYKIFDSQTTVTTTVFIWIDAYPDVSTYAYIFSIADSGGDICRVYLRKTAGGSNYVRLKRYYPAEVNDDWYGDIGVSTWVNFTTRFVKNSTTGGYWLWIDGTLRCDMSSLDTSTAGNPNRINVGTSLVSYTLTAYFDSVHVYTTDEQPPPDDPEPYMMIGWDSSGVFVSDTGFRPSGSYFDEYHINLIKESNGTMARIEVCVESWVNNYTTNCLGINYRDYMQYIVEKCHQYGLRVWITVEPFFDSYGTWSEGGDDQVSFSPYKLKQAVIENQVNVVHNWDIYAPTALGDWYLNWFMGVVQHLQPDGVDAMCETTSVVTDARFETWNREWIEAVRAYDPDMFCFVAGKGGDTKVWFNNRLGQLEYENIAYYFHYYYKPTRSHDWCQSFKNGDFTTGKAQLYVFLDSYFDELMPNVYIGATGAYRKEYNPSYPPDAPENADYFVNWDLAVQAFYDYGRDRDIGLVQFAFGKQTFPMLDIATHTQLNDAGELWAANMPAPTTDEAAPTYSDQWYNATEAGQPCEFSCKAMDETWLSKGVFGTNNTGVWVYDEAVSLSGKTDWLNVTKTLNSTVGAAIAFRYQFNDTSNNLVTTDIVYLTTSSATDTTPPVYMGVSHNDTYIGNPCLFTIRWQDETALNYSVFSTNNTGTWLNETVALTTNPCWHNVTKTLNSTEDTRVGYKYYANDTSNNWRSTTTYFVVITGINETEPILLFFNSTALRDLNDLYETNEFPYLSDCNGTIGALTYTLDYYGRIPSRLTFTVMAEAGNTSFTWITTQGLGAPAVVSGGSWSYNDDVLTLMVTHSSNEDVVIDWSPPFQWPDFAALLSGFTTAYFIYPVMIVGIVAIGLVILYYGEFSPYEYVRSAPWLLVVAAVGLIGVFVYYFVISAIIGAVT